MPSGLMPTYSYRPTRSGEPYLRTRSSRRARLFIGGTYFRARMPGMAGNNISIELVEYISGGKKAAKLIVTNQATDIAENVSGPANTVVLEQQLKWNERYQIEDLTTQPRARKYIISLQIAASISEVGPFSFNSALVIPSKLVVKLTPKTSEFTPQSVITIKPRVRMYDLVLKPAIPDSEEQYGSAEGWDAELLRATINAQDPWIEMMPRSGTPKAPIGAVAVPLRVKFDVQDDEIDSPMVRFADTKLTGGDGLPDIPTLAETGPIRSLVFINYGEVNNGSFTEVNEVYEWAGTSASAGKWQRY